MKTYGENAGWSKNSGNYIAPRNGAPVGAYFISNYVNRVQAITYDSNNVGYIGSSNINIKMTSVATVDDVKALFAANPLQICYSLATPVTYQLTPTEVQMLLGTNNIWADTGDILEGKYYGKKSSATRAMNTFTT